MSTPKVKKPIPRKRVTDGKVFKQFQADRQFEHHYFKLKTAEFQKNTSWVFKEPRLIPMEHTHLYHSCNPRNGAFNKNCVPTAGHFHEVEITWNEETGELVSAVCGPPLQVKKRVKGKRLISRVVPVMFEKDVDLPPQGKTHLVDTHVHDVEYMHSTLINLAARAAKVKETQAEVSGMVSINALKKMVVPKPQIPDGVDMQSVGGRKE